MKTHNTKTMWLVVIPALCLGLLFAGLAGASGVSTPNVFVAGTPANAEEVNANFAALETAVNDNDGRVTALEMTPPQRALAAIHVFWSPNVMEPSIVKSFNNLQDGETITVERTSAGVYVLDFGSTITAHQALGQGYLAATKGGIDGAGFATAQFDGLGEKAQVFVATYDETGMPADSSFYLVVN